VVRHKQIMNEHAAKIFKQLKEEAIQLHFRWLTYRQIFASSPQDIELLNKHGSNVFFLLQHLLLDNVALSLSKLTDPHEQGQNKNLSIQTLIQAIQEDGNSEFCGKLQGKFDTLKEQCAKFRLLRNKRIAHADFGHALQIVEEPLPGVSRTEIETTLETFRDTLNTVELHYFGSQTAYDMLIMAIGSDGSALLRHLREAKRIREESA